MLKRSVSRMSISRSSPSTNLWEKSTESNKTLMNHEAVNAGFFLLLLSHDVLSNYSVRLKQLT